MRLGVWLNSQEDAVGGLPVWTALPVVDDSGVADR